MTGRFLVDTNVVSELAKPKPFESVTSWIRSVEPLSLAAITLYELAFGVEMVPSGKRRRFLEEWLDDLRARADVIPFDAEAAISAARLRGELRRAGREMEKQDLFIAATAKSRRLTIATRNVGHFRGLGVGVYDPFSETYAI